MAVAAEQVADADAKTESADADKESGDNRSRSRRSPRHLRAAGQKRKKEQQQGDTDDAVEARYPQEQDLASEQQLDLPIVVEVAETVSVVAEPVVAKWQLQRLNEAVVEAPVSVDCCGSCGSG